MELEDDSTEMAAPLGSAGGLGAPEATKPGQSGLRLFRPPVDPLGMASVRARVEQALFGDTAPTKLGRYVLLGRIAGGGMGVVYGAYDPELHRKVALKVLHPQHCDNDRGHQRLKAEARALAKLDHANVVKVHDVLPDEVAVPGGRIVIVMALVEGQTLLDWQTTERRSIEDIVAAYRQAGEGLAAAHAVDIVHRDFKPANAIRGDDGRVQVLDFGLARAVGAEPGGAPSQPGEVSGSETTALTATGEIVGTLGYIAPELIAGAPPTPASDQFSFCVALHRAVEGVAPFAGQDLARLRDSIGRGEIAYARDGRAVPGWLRRAIARGLAAEPADRYPSMRALLDELGRMRGWRRWRATVVMAAAIAGAIGLASAIGKPEQAPCDGGIGDATAVWDGARRDGVRARLAALTAPAARGLDRRIPDALDGYRAAWVEGNRQACRDHRSGAQSADLLDRRMLCLHRRLDDLGATVQVLSQIDDASASQAIDAVARLPAVAACGDVEALNAASPPPSTPALQAEVAGIRRRLSEAAALDRVGRDREARSVAEAALTSARRTSYPPVEVEAALLDGKILLFSHECKAAIEPLARAEALALEHGMYPAAVEAAARRLYCEGVEGATQQQLEPRIAVMEALGRGLRGDHFALPLLLNNVGVAFVAQGRRDQATRYFEAAHAALARIPQPDLELVTIEHSLALLTRDPQQREALVRGAWQRLDRELGSIHPLTLETLSDYARYVVDPALAVTLATRACEGYQRFYPEQVVRRAYCFNYVGFLRSELGDRTAAAEAYDAAIAATAGSTDHGAAIWHHLSNGERDLALGDPRTAIAELSPIVAQYTHSAGWWERQYATQASLGIGIAQYRLGNRDAAVRALEAAVAGYSELIGLTELVENHARLALARYTLASALLQFGGSRSQVARLTEQARQFYLAANPGAYRGRLAATMRAVR
jgi:tetratricopeptide (TPR) repeat protein